MGSNALNGVGLRRGWLVVPLEVDVAKANGELSRCEWPLTLISGTMGRGEYVTRPNERTAAPEFRAS